MNNLKAIVIIILLASCGEEVGGNILNCELCNTNCDSCTNDYEKCIEQDVVVKAKSITNITTNSCFTGSSYSTAYLLVRSIKD